MKSSFGLSASTIAQIHAVLKKYPEIEKAVIYGSRAKGNFREGSDIDLTLFGDVGTNTVADVIDALDDSNLPYLFDVSVFELIENEKLREHIDRVGKVFYEREEVKGAGARNGWEEKKLGEVCDFDKSPNGKNNLPYVGLEHIESNTGEFVGTTEPQLVKSLTFHFTSEHILYGRLRPYLNKVLLPTFEGHCSTEIFPIRTKQGLDRRFLFHWLLSDETVKKIDATSTGARMPRANMNAFLEFQIPLPPLPEQKRIVAILDEAFAGIAPRKGNRGEESGECEGGV